MSLTEAQRRALAILRPQRSEQSWFAGSLVLHPILSRAIGDIDIHQSTRDDMLNVFRRDAQTLLHDGFVLTHTSESRHEIEGAFRKAQMEVSVNWVHSDDEHLFPLERGELLAFHISTADAVFQKLLMVFGGDEEKHFDDLASCVHAKVLYKELVLLAARRKSPNDPEAYISRVEDGIRHTGRIIGSSLYSSMPANRASTWEADL